MKRAVKIGLPALLLGFLFWNIAVNWQEVSNVAWNFRSLNTLVLLLFLLLVYLVNVFSWHMVTRVLGAKVSFGGNFRIWMLSNLSRLLPGGIWQYPSRVYLLSREGVTKRVSITAVILEGLLILALGSGTVFLSLAFWQLPEEFKGAQNLLWLFLVLPLMIFSLANPKIATGAARIIKKLTGREGKLLSEIHLPLYWLIPLAVLFFARFFFTGGALFFLTNIAAPLGWEFFFVIIGIYSLSWLLGYVAVFAPGGLGVVEVSLAALLSLYIPFALASIIAIVFRLALLLAEAVFLGIAFLVFKTRS